MVENKQPLAPNTKATGSKSQKFFRQDLPRFFLLIATIIVFLLFGLKEPKMMNMENIFNIIATASITGTVAIGVMIGMVSGEMNFAAGAQATIAAALVGEIMGVKHPIPYIAAIVISLAFCVLAGSGTSFLSQKVGVPSFIASLGIATIITGFVKLITENKVVFSRYWTKTYTFIGQYKIAGKVPIIVVIFALIALLAWILIDKTKLGRHIYAVGSAKTTCKQVGINVQRIKWYAMMISAAVAGFAGIMSTSREFNVRPTMGGELMLDAIAAVMLGATFLRPGRPNVQGTVIAAILVTIITNGIYTIGWSFSLKYIITGVIFIIAVGFIAMTRKEGLPSVSFGK
jgi:ribose/xylose/arabinose/galactoside ABC-type transport system permease subunit